MNTRKKRAKRSRERPRLLEKVKEEQNTENKHKERVHNNQLVKSIATLDICKYIYSLYDLHK